MSVRHFVSRLGNSNVTHSATLYLVYYTEPP